MRLSAVAFASLAVGCVRPALPQCSGYATTETECACADPIVVPQPSAPRGTLFGEPFVARSTTVVEQHDPPDSVGVRIADTVFGCADRASRCAATIYVVVGWKTGARATSLSAYDKLADSGSTLGYQTGTAEAVMLYAEGRKGRLRVRVDDPQRGARFDGEVSVIRCP